MGVAEIMTDSEMLNAQGRKEGCLRALLIGVAATARKRYPKKKKKKKKAYGDKQAFEAFLRAEMAAGNFFGPQFRAGVRLHWRGKETPLEEILYRLRCALVHEAEMHEHVRFESLAVPGKLVLSVAEGGIFVFQESLLVCMKKCVHNAQENRGELRPMPFVRHGGGTVEGNGFSLVFSGTFTIPCVWQGNLGTPDYPLEEESISPSKPVRW